MHIYTSEIRMCLIISSMLYLNGQCFFLLSAQHKKNGVSYN